MNTLTAALDRPPPTTLPAHKPAIAPTNIPIGPTAAELVCGWLFVDDRRIGWPYTWMAVALALAMELLARPIARPD